MNKEKFQAFSLTDDALIWLLEENGYRDISLMRNLIDEIEGGAERMSPEVLAMKFIVATK